MNRMTGRLRRADIVSNGPVREIVRTCSNPHIARAAAARPTEAHAVLAPALDDFAPTPEMLEIAEAQAVLSRTRVDPLNGDPR